MKSFYKNILTILLSVFSACACCEQNILNIYAWGNYLPRELIIQFTKETGIKVNLSEYDNNETMFAKLRASSGHNSGEYDIVIPSTYYIERMTKNGMLHSIDKSKLPNLKYLNKLLLNKKFDPRNKYSIPYLWGSVGIIINTEYINPKNIISWQNFWDKKYKNQLMIIDDVRDVFSIALLSLGYSINDTNPSHIEQAYYKLIQLLPNIKIFNIDTVPNIYIDKDAIIGMSWSGDCKIAQKENNYLQYIYPKEGFPIWIDSFAILQNSKHLENAYKFINFMLRPEIAKQVTLILGFTTANQAAIKLLPKSIQNDPLVNPDPKTIKKGTIQLDPPDNLKKLYEKYWEKLKIEN